MSRLMVLLLSLSCLFSKCKLIQSSEKNSSNTASKRINRQDGENTNTPPDSVVVTGAVYIPLYGHSEAGVQPDLEGSWVLQSMEGYAPKGNVRSKLDSIEKNKYTIANRHDSTTFTSVQNGVRRTTTEIILDRSSVEQSKLTPAQGANYHIPERPSISFFGSNETFSGFTGCNKYAGRYILKDSTSLNLKSANPSTRMVCIGDWDEDKYLDLLRRVNKFKGTESNLELMEGDKVILTFSRKPE